jgi:predicted phage-related endonuclease
MKLKLNVYIADKETIGDAINAMVKQIGQGLQEGYIEEYPFYSGNWVIEPDTMNDRDDFSPELRNSAIWSGDSRKVANGKMVDVILEKQGKKELPDLSHVEAVQMGHTMQPVIGRLAQERLGMELKEADYAITHPKHDWFRSHFDFISADGRTLVEAKNYNAMVRNQFDTDSNRIPDADYAQLIHEAACHGVDRIILAVLFGGQEFCTFAFDITDVQKDELIKKMAQVWGYCQSGNLPPAESIEQTKIMFPQSSTAVITATRQVELAISELKDIKNQIKHLEDAQEKVEVAIRNLMGECQEIRTVDGQTLVTWKSSKSTQRFSVDLFKSAMPDIYEQFVVEQLGARRFLVK